MAEDGGKFSFFLFGLGLGVAVGVLFAPRSGQETREFIRSRADQSKDYLKQRSEEIRSTANEALDRGKGIVTKQRENLSAAIEAGRQAYRDAISGKPSEGTS